MKRTEFAYCLLQNAECKKSVIKRFPETYS